MDVAELRRLGGKTFEYVTYPTEAHGLLRVEPQLHFYRLLDNTHTLALTYLNIVCGL